MEREKIREREPAQRDDAKHYEETLNIYAALRERAKGGKIVIKAQERPWRQARQGLLKTFGKTCDPYLHSCRRGRRPSSPNITPRLRSGGSTPPAT